MAEPTKFDAFEMYSKGSKSWMDAFSSWTKINESFPQTFKGADMGMWFKPYWDRAEDWGKVYGNFASTLKTMPLPYSSMKDTSDGMTKGFNSYVKVYDAWFKTVDALAREGSEMTQKMTRGEPVESRGLFESARKAYDNVSAAWVESLKDSPFAGAKDIDQAVKNSLDSFTDEQRTAAQYTEEMLNLSMKTMNLSSTTMKEASEAMTEMYEKGTISGAGYNKMADAYAEALKRSSEMLRFPVMIAPGYKDITDDATGWSKASMELGTSWMEASIKITQGMARSWSEVYKASEDTFKEAKMTSADEFYRKMTEAWSKATEIMVKNSQLNESVPKFISCYTGWVKATNSLYQTITTSPFPTKEDFSRTSEEIEKIRRTMERKARAEVKEAKEAAREEVA